MSGSSLATQLLWNKGTPCPLPRPQSNSQHNGHLLYEGTAPAPLGHCERAGFRAHHGTGRSVVSKSTASSSPCHGPAGTFPSVPDASPRWCFALASMQNFQRLIQFRFQLTKSLPIACLQCTWILYLIFVQIPVNRALCGQCCIHHEKSTLCWVRADGLARSTDAIVS